MSVRCMFGHRWLGHPPFGFGYGSVLCNRTCTRCGKQSYGWGVHEMEPLVTEPLPWPPVPGGLPAAQPREGT